MTDEDLTWRAFLTRWSEEWADSWRPGDRGPEAAAARWLGFGPADEARIVAAEERLGHRLPPSYREFLAVSDGWRHAGRFVDLLAGTEGARWYQDTAGLGETYREDVDEDSPREAVLLAGMWGRALQLDLESDLTYVLMDPGDIGPDGEWAVYCYFGWSGEYPQKYASFRDFMASRYRDFHRARAGDHAKRPFANATTRALDARVEQARRDALSGRYEEAAEALAEAESYGRPRARELRDQIRRLLGETYLVTFGAHASDPVYAPEVLAVLALGHVTYRRDDASWQFVVRSASEEVRALGKETLRRVRKGGYGYTAPGPFGEAVETAREQLRWGGTEEAWHTLLTAMPQWRPAGPDQLAPLGLLADPLLGTLFTPEHGAELLATPRGEAAGPAPSPASAPPDGLAWLTRPQRGQGPAGYRFVLVEGAGPAELPALIGADGAATVLHEPMTAWEARSRLLKIGESSSYDDRAVVGVGRAGDGWSFAFDGQPGPFSERRFTSPAAAASVPGRAVVVWSTPPHSAGRPALFRLSVAERGEERYAFTVKEAEHGPLIQRTGQIPAALDPDAFTTDGIFVESWALAALAAEFGVSLPCFALTRGRLHTFITRSWIRPPGPGEGYVVMRVGMAQPPG
ncbi:SMI1/KNR4 family protein [Streptomyces sp. NBC_01476]|uniref:SMI1/KNR4 family protein n=1 Tax=Streptomyces sp. NBC_01476 TaxID=2903881 RepID=UPI002E3540DC|nr:SMI1/KNR4 family protein [Streptomyces sp. NBC_01476]